MPLTIFEEAHHLTGTAPDTPPLVVQFEPEALVLDILITGNDARIAFSSDGMRFSSPRLFPAGLVASLNQRVAALAIQNAVAGSDALFDITGFYSPIEIVGKPYDDDEGA